MLSCAVKRDLKDMSGIFTISNRRKKSSTDFSAQHTDMPDWEHIPQFVLANIYKLIKLPLYKVIKISPIALQQVWGSGSLYVR